ncbi:hypothetical protein [Curtobacterium sp. MCBD17_003]|uniref:hypothetical protein n=1 Tax=Curtobacterium sp. MCBD17_003 TaxID=2175667 RepID=UPI0015E8D28F|nr:hypothetical protein [Curtobacterium sp. MCBD17_003]WIE54360.1 hypothetical protein DEI88_014760 [Curtobacterium sp. MCBD17_003]
MNRRQSLEFLLIALVVVAAVGLGWMIAPLAIPLQAGMFTCYAFGSLPGIIVLFMPVPR